MFTIPASFRSIVRLPFVLSGVFLLLLVSCTAQPMITTTPVPATPSSPSSPPVPIGSSPTAARPILSATASPEWGPTITPQVEEGDITCMAYSPDGRWLAVGTSLGVHLYQAQTLVPLRFIATNARVTYLAFSPDGQMLASNSGEVTLWRVIDGAQLYMLNEYISVLAFSPDGNLLATGGNGGKVWRAKDGTLLQNLDVNGTVTDLRFSEDGHSLVTAGDTVRLWAVPEWSLLRDFPTPYSMVGCRKVFFAQKGQMLITFCNGAIAGWDIKDGSERYYLDADIYADGVAVSLNGDHLATSGMELSLYQVADGSFIQKLQDYTSSESLLAFAPNGNILASSANLDVKLWDVSQGTLLQSLPGLYAGAFAFSSDSTLLAVIDHSNNEVQVWQIAVGTMLARLDGRGRVLPAPVSPSQIMIPTPLPPDQHWATSFRMAGLDGTVRTLASDSTGNLYAGGDFVTADGLWVNHIARWDGAAWHPMGGGLDPVNALATDHRGNVYAATFFAGEKRIARWDGAVWNLLPGVFDNYIDDLATDSQGNLYVAGSFSAIDNLLVHHIARYDGASWSPLDNGLEYMAMDIVVSPQDHLYVSSGFANAGGNSAYHVYEWDGKFWRTLGDTFDEIIYTLAIDDAGMIYAGGLFMAVGELPAHHIAKWDGTTWLSLGTGLGENQSEIDDCVKTIAIDPQGRLLAGGYTLTTQRRQINYLARWDGQTWTELGGGTSNPILTIQITNKGMIAVGGEFSRAGDTPAHFLASWEGSNWKALESRQDIGVGLDGNVLALALDDQDQLYVGGEFQRAGQKTVNYIARWDGRAWIELGSGLNGPVASLALDSRGNLYASGDFTSAGERSANHIALWNGTTWSALGNGFDFPTRLTMGQNGTLYAYWIEAGGVSFRVAQWDGTTWHSFETSNREYCDPFGCEMIVDHQGNLYTGNFELPVAKWDDGNWVILGDKTFPGKFYVDAQDTLYVSGQNMEPMDRLFKWDGAAWLIIGNFPLNSDESSTEYFGTIDAILAGNEPGTLFAVGSAHIDYQGGVQSLYFWDGLSWKKLADLGTFEGSVSELALDSLGNLYLGGTFTAVGRVPSSYLALWHPN